MVQIIPLVGAAALLAQTAFAAVVPVRRTSNYNSNNYNNNNNYNSGSSNAYQQSENQDSNQSGNNYNNNYNAGSNYNSGNSYNNNNNYNSGSNQYNNNNNMMNQYQYNQQTTTVEQMMMETTTTMMDMAMQTTADMAMDVTTTTAMMADTTTTSMMAEQTTVLQQEITTTSPSYSMPSYGSGSSNWNNGYNNCVQQCMAQFGSPSTSMEMQQSQQNTPSGSGATHTIYVAPDGAGLRYVPFSVNATVGDTIHYVWTNPAKNHTATLSSQLEVCNKSGIAEQRNWVSGLKNAAQGVQTFDVVLQDSTPQFFYCSVATHCEQGMFGIVNSATSTPESSNTVGYMMSTLMQSNPQLQAAYSYMMQNITGSGYENWGMNMSLDGIPQDQYLQVAANVLYTQGTFALNPGMLESGQGASNPDGSPIQWPSGLNVLLSESNAATPSEVSSEGPLSHATVTPAATGSLTPVNAYGNGALGARSVSTWLAVIVGVAGWLLI